MIMKRKKFTIALYRSPSENEYNYTMVKTPEFHRPNFDQISGQDETNTNFITTPYDGGRGLTAGIDGLALLAIAKGIRIKSTDLVTTIDAPILVAGNRDYIYRPVSDRELIDFAQKYLTVSKKLDLS